MSGHELRRSEFPVSHGFDLSADGISCSSSGLLSGCRFRDRCERLNDVDDLSEAIEDLNGRVDDAGENLPIGSSPLAEVRNILDSESDVLDCIPCFFERDSGSLGV